MSCTRFRPTHHRETSTTALDVTFDVSRIDADDGIDETFADKRLRRLAERTRRQQRRERERVRDGWRWATGNDSNDYD